MGGASCILTADSKEELIEKAIKWYEDASKIGLYPRDYVYGKGETVIEFDSSFGTSCGTKIEKAKANIHIIDTNDKPKGVEVKYPFPCFAQFTKEKDLKKRFHAFVSVKK